jgi:hypothetical protein
MKGKRSSPNRRPERSHGAHRGASQLPRLRIGIDQMESGYAGFLVSVCLVAVAVFPPIFFGGHHGASVKQTFAIAALVGLALTWTGILRWSPVRPGGRLPQPRYTTAAPLSAIAIILIVVLPVPILAEIAGLCEGFFVAIIVMWAMDFYRLTRWKRRARPS